MRCERLLELLHTHLQLIYIFLWHESQLDFLEVLLGYLELIEQVLDLLSLFLQLLVCCLALSTQISHLFL